MERYRKQFNCYINIVENLKILLTIIFYYVWNNLAYIHKFIIKIIPI